MIWYNYSNKKGIDYMDSTKQSKSHLSEIMKTLNISGKKLALSLHIDETLVSKYKNNKRRLSKETTFEISWYIAEYHAKESSLFFRLTRNILEPYAEKILEACTDYYYNMLNEIKQNAHLILKKII